MTSSNTDKQLLSSMQSMKENDFTKKILIPLFMSFGYEKVEFYGGPYEEGKDLIAWKLDDWGDIEVTVVQSKFYKPTAKAGGGRTFGEIVTQIGQAANTPIEHTTGQTYLPSIVHFVTPYAIDTRALASNFSTINNIKSVRIKIIDGTSIVKKIKENIPHIIVELIGSSQLVNE